VLPPPLLPLMVLVVVKAALRGIIVPAAVAVRGLVVSHKGTPGMQHREGVRTSGVYHALTKEGWGAWVLIVVVQSLKRFVEEGMRLCAKSEGLGGGREVARVSSKGRRCWCCWCCRVLFTAARNCCCCCNQLSHFTAPLLSLLTGVCCQCQQVVDRGADICGQQNHTKKGALRMLYASRMLAAGVLGCHAGAVAARKGVRDAPAEASRVL
jgi:hypothetical protein